jgi:hypothetical protein
MTDWETEWRNERALELEKAKTTLREFVAVLKAREVPSFEFRGHGEGDSPESGYFNDGEEEYYSAFPELPAQVAHLTPYSEGWLDDLGWALAGVLYNNEGGGWTMTWNEADMNFSAFYNETVENTIPDSSFTTESP